MCGRKRGCHLSLSLSGVTPTLRLFASSLSRSCLPSGVLTTCEINAMEEGEDALDLAALATAFRASNEVRKEGRTHRQAGRQAHLFSHLPPTYTC